MPVCCWQVGSPCGILYLSGLLESEAPHVKNDLPYLSALLASETTYMYVEFVCHAYQLLASRQPMWNFIPVCAVSKWSSLSGICVPYLSAVGKWSSLWTLSAMPVRSWNLSAVPVFTFGMWNSLCGICLPYLSALLASEEANVESVCHICQHCWQVKQLS